MPRIFKTLFSAATVASVAFFGQTVCGQDEVETDSPAEAVTEMTVMAVDDGGGAPSVFFSSSSGEFSTPLIPGVAGGSFSMPAPDPWNMISNPSVQMDLDLVDDQKSKIDDLKKKMSAATRELVGSLQGGKIDRDAIDRLRSSQGEYKEQMMELLLPSQQDRLKQIALQMHMKSAGTTTAITNKAVAEALGITPEQTEKLQSKAKELKKKMAEDIEKLKEKMKQELLAELTPEQREKLNELKGDEYKPEKSDWNNRFKRLRRGSSIKGN